MPTARAGSTTSPSKVWYDGQNHCWTGKLAWTFKNGSWFYGSYRWSEIDGTWRTSAPEAPTSVDCETVPAFAGKICPQSSQANGQKEFAAEAERRRPKTLATAREDRRKAAAEESAQLAPPADGNAVRASECKKYFPSVGEMLPVPCRATVRRYSRAAEIGPPRSARD